MFQKTSKVLLVLSLTVMTIGCGPRETDVSNSTVCTPVTTLNLDEGCLTASVTTNPNLSNPFPNPALTGSPVKMSLKVAGVDPNFNGLDATFSSRSWNSIGQLVDQRVTGVVSSDAAYRALPIWNIPETLSTGTYTTEYRVDFGVCGYIQECKTITVVKG